MKAVFTIFLLAALTGAARSLFKRSYILVDKSKLWTEAQAYCRSNYVDLMTIFLPQDYENFKTYVYFLVTKNILWGSYWTGLTLDSDGTTQWSDESPLRKIFWGLTPDIYPNTLLCLTFTPYSGTWQSSWQFKDCDNNFKFFCYVWEPQPIVVQEMKTWVEALDYCRTNYTDLISLPWDVDLFVANNKSLDIQTSRFWTGLRFLDHSWFYVNTDNLGHMTQLNSVSSCPVWPIRCGARMTDLDGWDYRDCNEKMNFICYNKTM